MTREKILANKEPDGRLAEIAQELAEYGLGIFRPHGHDTEGQPIELAPNQIAYEVDRLTHFIPVGTQPKGADVVGWRWMDDHLEPFAFCCSRQC